MSAAGGAPSRWRRLLFWVLVADLVGLAVVLGVLLLGESSRATLLVLYAPRHPLLAASVAGLVLAPLTGSSRRRRRALVAVFAVLTLLVLFPVMGLTLGRERTAASARPIRIASYNVFFGKAGRAELVEEIAAMPVDLVVIQAAYGSLGDKLRERLPDRVVKQEGELAIVSRFPVREVKVPPPLPGGTPAMFLEVVVDTPSGALRVFDLHAYSPRHALFDGKATELNVAQREAQVAACVLAARREVPPFVIVGDTNLPVLSGIAREHFAGLTDAFAEVGTGFGWTFPAKHPWMRIDRALGSEGVRFLSVRVAPRGASDHRALLVDVEVEGG